MTDADTPPQTDVALIVGGGPGISASCARLFAREGMRVAVAARNPDKPVLQQLTDTHGVYRYACDAGDPDDVARLFAAVVGDLGAPNWWCTTSTAGSRASSARASARSSRPWCATRCATRRSAPSWSASRRQG
jgi:NAD(P)-dependent dehydrogenase (short-subunit alcohol dehydrogenase family)